MNDRQKTYDSLSRAAWGYFFLFFDFSIGTVNLLPRFIGFLLFYSAAKVLESQRRDLALLRPLCLLLAAYSLANWVFSWFGADLSEYSMFLALLATAAELYFHFQFLTDLAALAEQYQTQDNNLSRRILTRRTALVVLATVIGAIGEVYKIHGTFLFFDGQPFPQSFPYFFQLILTLLSCLIVLFIMTAIFSLRKCFWQASETIS